MDEFEQYVARRQAEHPQYEFDERANGWRVDDSDPARVVWVVPFMFTAAIITGRDGGLIYDDRWCYHSVPAALAAAQAWVDAGGQGEPDGWHRHPSTGRRRDGGREYVRS